MVWSRCVLAFVGHICYMCVYMRFGSADNDGLGVFTFKVYVCVSILYVCVCVDGLR